MEKLVEMEILGLSSNHSQSGSFTLVMGEVEGVRRLPIVIGMFEAQAIAIEIEKIVPNRPMTHDLFKSFADSFQFQIEKIVISEFKEGVFYAKIICRNEEFVTEIDSRTSDAIAIGVRFSCPIYSVDKVLDEVGSTKEIEDLEEDFDLDTELDDIEMEEDDNEFSSQSVEELQTQLNDALSNEQYELASKIRDEIKNRTK